MTSSPRRLRAATRGSPLARWQTGHIAALLAAADRGTEVEPVVLSTEGDRRRDVPLSTLGGKGVFVKEIQAAVLDGRADLAVHSAKDLPAVTPDGLVLATVPDRADPRDALVGRTLAEIPPGGTVATGSRRRQAQITALRPDLTIVELRGNMATRVARAADVDAVIVAAAALDRLDLSAMIAERLEPHVMVPQVGQGSLAVECRADDVDTLALLAAIEDPTSRRRLDAERAFLAALGGDCDLPAGAYATVDGAADGSGGEVTILAVLEVDGVVRRVERSGSDGEDVGRAVAIELSA